MAGRLRKPLLCRGGLSIWWSKAGRQLALAAAMTGAVLLSACGFQPILAERDRAAIKIATLDLPNTPMGARLADALAGRIERAADSAITVRVALEETARDTLIDSAGQAQRKELGLTAKLVARGGDGAVVFVKQLTVTESYDYSGDEMTRQQSADEIRRVVIARLADELAMALRDGLQAAAR